MKVNRRRGAGQAQDGRQAQRELWITGKAGTSAVAREVWFAQATRLAVSFGYLQSGLSIQRSAAAREDVGSTER
jgi:hypothetical protein